MANSQFYAAVGFWYSEVALPPVSGLILYQSILQRPRFLAEYVDTTILAAFDPSIRQ